MGTVEVWVIVVAAGTGARFGAEKQYVVLRDRPVLAWSVHGARRAFASPAAVDTIGTRPVLGRGHLAGRDGPDVPIEGGVSGVGGVVAVVPVHRVGEGSFGADVVVAGGSSRSASVRAGLSAVPATAEVIVVHDAARPLATAALFAAVIGAVIDGADAAVPGLEVTDTIRRKGGGTLDRSDLVRVQTPQAFRAGALRAAHQGPAEATDDATLVEQAGGTVVVVPGEMTNIKLTDPTDLAVAETLLNLRPCDAPPPSEAPPGRSLHGAPTGEGSNAAEPRP